MTTSEGGEAPDPGLPERSTWDTGPAALAAAAYAAIQGPVWDRIVIARTEEET